MTWAVQPEPADEAERSALLRALEEALGQDAAGATPSPNSSRWWRSGLADLSRGAAPQELGREPGVIEP